MNSPTRIPESVVVFSILLVSAFAGVATRRMTKREKVWTPIAILYAVIAAIVTALAMKWMGFLP